MTIEGNELSTKLEHEELPNGNSCNVYLDPKTKAFVSTLEDPAGKVVDYKAFPKRDGLSGGDATGAWLWYSARIQEQTSGHRI